MSPREILRVVFLASAFAVLRAGAEPAVISLRDGEVLREAEIIGRDEAFVTIRHDSGVTRVPIADLPQELKKALDYDPLAAAKRLGEEKRLLEKEQKTVAAHRRLARIEGRKIYVTGVIRARRRDGLVVLDGSYVGETTEKYWRFDTPPPGETWKPKRTAVTKTVRKEVKLEGVLVAGLPDKWLEGDAWAGHLWPAGEAQITNAENVVIGMQVRYAASPEIALQIADAAAASAR